MALTKPFAEHGDKLEIPQTASDSSVSYDQGFTYAYARPPEEGGKFIERAQFNQLMYDTTSAVIDNSNNITRIQGDVATAKGNITTLQQKTSNLENNVSTLETQASTGVGYLTQNLTWNIGAGGDYTTIVDALRAARKYNTIGDKIITLSLQQNYAGNEDLLSFYGNYDLIIINGNNHTFDFSNNFLRFFNLNLIIKNLNIVGEPARALIEMYDCPKVILDSVRINTTGIMRPVLARNSRLKIMGVCNFTTTAETCIDVLGGQTDIVATTTYSSTASNIVLGGGAVVYSFSPATANVTKNIPTRNGLFFN